MLYMAYPIVGEVHLTTSSTALLTLVSGSCCHVSPVGNAVVCSSAVIDVLGLIKAVGVALRLKFAGLWSVNHNVHMVNDRQLQTAANGNTTEV